MIGPTSDAEVPAWWRALGLPGLFDAHVHFLPPPIQDAVWREFESAGEKIGRGWPIHYRGSIQKRVGQLRALGVRRFTTLPYAHKPGVATFLNDWSAQFAGEVPEALRSATFYPEPGAAEYVERQIDDGAEVFKVHAQVGEFALDHKLLAPVWELLAARGTPVVIHVGSGPVGNAFTGPGHLARMLRQFPQVRVIIAHLGAPECAEFFDLAEAYEHTWLDTAMVFTDFFEEFPTELLPRLARLGDKILYGSDFPSLPHSYAVQLAGMARLADREPALGEDWLRKVCWDNAIGLFGG